MKLSTDGADKVADTLDDKLRTFLEDFYQIAWGHGTADQIFMRPDAFYNRYVEKLKKVIQDEV